MKCPKCEIDMSDKKIGNEIYFKCVKCNGLWFDKGELEKIKFEKNWFNIDSIVENASSNIAESKLKCPRDLELLHTIKYSLDSDIKVNVCSECEGLWLDAGELLEIHKASESWLERLKEKAEEELIAIELFLIKIGPHLPR